jgi:hypothetical protein
MFDSWANFKHCHMPGPCTFDLACIVPAVRYYYAASSNHGMRRASDRCTQLLHRAAFLCSTALMCIATTRLLRQVPLIRQRSQVRAMAKYSYECSDSIQPMCCCTAAARFQNLPDLCLPYACSCLQPLGATSTAYTCSLLLVSSLAGILCCCTVAAPAALHASCGSKHIP